MSIARIISNRNITIVTCDPRQSVADAITSLSEQRIGAMPVMDQEGTVIGVFSERDVIRCLRERGGDALAERVEAVMTAPAVTVTPDTTEDKALALMTQRRIRHLPVMDGGRMVDFVSIGDLVKSRIDAVEAEAAAMRSYIRNA